MQLCFKQSFSQGFSNEKYLAKIASKFAEWDEPTQNHITEFFDQSGIWLDGKIAPGPDYRLYLTADFVDTGAGFKAINDKARQIGPIKAYENFAIDLPADVDLSAYKGVLIWCEAFGQFITAARLETR